MAHGTPDWWGTEPSLTVYKVSDLGELAVRLGSIVTFDRRGDVMFLTSFEHGLGGWSPTLVGDGADISLSADTARNGAYSLKMIGGKDGERYAEISRIFPYPALSDFGMEISFTVEADVEKIDFEFHILDGTDDYIASLRYIEATTKIQYLDSGGTFQDLFTGLDLIEADGCFHTLKLVIDGSAQEYVRVLVDDQADTLPGEGMSSVSSPGASAIWVKFMVYSDSGKNGQAYLDDLIITQNEP